MTELPENARKGDRLTAAEVREMARASRRANRPIRAQANSGITVNDAYNEVSIGFDVRQFEKKQAAGGEVRLGYILALVPTAVEMLMMQFLDYTIQTFTDAQDQEITRVLWAPDGGPHLAFVAPNMRAADVRLLVPVALNAGTPIFRCDKIKDMWFATFLPRWAIRAKPDGITIVRCQ